MSSRGIGLMGLAVMGQNPARNLDRNHTATAVYNRSPEVAREFMAGPHAPA